MLLKVSVQFSYPGVAEIMMALEVLEIIKSGMNSAISSDFVYTDRKNIYH
jgi:hypothetical protein